MRSLFEYTDFRTYLRDYLDSLRLSGAKVTNRAFAAKVGAKSSSWLSEILAGKKGLSKETANKISAACAHNRRETAFFEALVFFNQARTIEERNYYYREVVSIQRSALSTVLSGDQYEFYGTWYHSAVRALLATRRCTDDYATLGSAVRPRLTEAQVRESIALLERLGMIRRASDGAWELTSKSITTGDHMGALAVSNYQQESIRLGLESMDRFERSQRDISTLTISIGESEFDQIKAEIREFRQRLAHIAEHTPQADRVCQLNVQFFPLSAPDSTPEGRSA